jgi:hypothetical protein
MNKDYTIVTVSSRIPQEWYYLQKEFYKSLEGHEVLTINNSKENHWKGLATKPKWLYKAIKDGLIKTRYMQFVDSWDLIYGASPDEVMQIYFSFDKPIVISAESNCFPDTYKKEYDELSFPKPYCYLNSGVIIGETSAILSCLETMDLENVKDDHWDKERNCAYHSNDQTMWQEIFLKQPVPISLDYSQAISQTLHNAKIDDFDFDELRIRNKITTTHPRIWHFNGGSKDNKELRDPILTRLGFTETKDLYETYFGLH